jgi:hypothetical protein
MLITEVIKGLQEILKVNGDLQVSVYSEGNYNNLENLRLNQEDEYFFDDLELKKFVVINGW